MLNKFYTQQNYYSQELSIFTKIEERDKLILKNNKLAIKNNDDCNGFLVVISIIIKILSDENENSKDIKVFVEKVFTDYLQFIDSVINYVCKKNCFQDQYLILLTEIEKNVKQVNNGLTNLIVYQNDHELKLIYKSILFTLFDFSVVLNNIKKNINIENTHHLKLNIKKDNRTYSF